MRTRLHILFIAIGLSVGTGHANPLSDRPDSLVFSKGDGVVRVNTSYRHSQEFNDWIFAFEPAYGLTDRLNLWLSIPIVHRSESMVFNGSDTGLGDTTAGVRYLLLRSRNDATQLALDLNGKFPSGDTDVHFVNTKTGDSAELPLGGGYAEIEPAVAFRQQLGDLFSALFSAGYAFRLPARVEYL